MAKTVKVAQTSDLAPGTSKVVQADGHSIGLFNVEGTLTLLADPHQMPVVVRA